MKASPWERNQFFASQEVTVDYQSPKQPLSNSQVGFSLAKPLADDSS